MFAFAMGCLDDSVSPLFAFFSIFSTLNINNSYIQVPITNASPMVVKRVPFIAVLNVTLFVG